MKLPAMGLRCLSIAIVGIAGSFIVGCHGVGRVQLAGCCDSRSQACLNEAPRERGSCCDNGPHLRPTPASPQFPTPAPPENQPPISTPPSDDTRDREESPPYTAYHRRGSMLQNIEFGLRKLHSNDGEFPRGTGVATVRPDTEERVPELADGSPRAAQHSARRGRLAVCDRKPRGGEIGRNGVR